jgi:hypothetical protein
MGSTKPGFGSRAPRFKKGSSIIDKNTEELLLVILEKQNRCRDCKNEYLAICCGKFEKVSRCDLFDRLVDARNAGISMQRYVIPIDERMERQNELVLPCENCSMLNVKCKGLKLKEEDIYEEAF